MAPDGILNAPFACPECGFREFHRARRTRTYLHLAGLFTIVGLAVGEPLLTLTALLASAIGVMLIPDLQCGRCLVRWTPRIRPKIEPPLPDPEDMLEYRCPGCGSFEVYDSLGGLRCHACGRELDQKK